MRLLILPLILTALPASAAQTIENKRAAPPAEAARPLSDSCERADLHQAQTPKRAEGRKLGELPPGDTLLAVYDNVDGCLEPRIVRYGDGRASAPSVQPEPQRPRARVWR
jgi:hypothetical protein